MTNLQKYNNVFIERFAVTEQDLNTGLVYQSIPAWDSVGHMSLMAAIEEAFDIILDMDDILDFSSYQKGKEILDKYRIDLK